jgi:hypothetical protein
VRELLARRVLMLLRPAMHGLIGTVLPRRALLLSHVTNLRSASRGTKIKTAFFKLGIAD